MRKSLSRSALATLVALASGCSVVPQTDAGRDAAVPQSLVACGQWFAQQDDAIDRAGVRDGGAYRLPGFAYLRTDRFAASFAPEVEADADKFSAWLARLRALDAEARHVEFSNLPENGRPGPGGSQAGAMELVAADCAARLAARDSASPDTRRHIAALAKVPDDYSLLARTLGLYPLTSLAFASGIRAWQRETEEAFRQAAMADPADDAMVRYVPDAMTATAQRAADILSRSLPDALGIPRISGSDGAVLLASFAPAFEVEGRARHDRIGAVGWAADSTPAIDIDRADVYGRIAFTRYRTRTLVQLVYTAWFPERPAAGATDPLSGALDGIMLRITLDPEGRPLLVDSIHPCGCYHLFFPTARITPRPAPPDQVEWMFAPAQLPSPEPGRSLVFRVASGTHYLTRVYADDVRSGARAGAPYRLADENGLRSLPLPQGGRRSLYGPDGIVPGTERLERLFFWPMGIADAGAMRQWGRHATAFVGRRHFDAPDLIEERFEIPGIETRGATSR